MLRALIAGGICVFSLVLVADSSLQGGDKKEVTIKDVMRIAHSAKKGMPTLLEKVRDGEATKEEKAKLIELYTAMSKATPPKGDADSWKTRTTALLEAVKTENVKGIMKASACTGCHTEHKPKKGG